MLCGSVVRDRERERESEALCADRADIQAYCAENDEQWVAEVEDVLGTISIAFRRALALLYTYCNPKRKAEHHTKNASPVQTLALILCQLLTPSYAESLSTVYRTH
jgi:hypothetical protein